MSTILPFLLPIDTLSDEELLEHGTFLDSLPGDVRELIAGMKTDEAIRESIAQRYSLNESQFRGIHRFVMEAVLRRGVPTPETAALLMNLAGITQDQSIQIIKELEASLFQPLGLSLAGLAQGAPEPTLMRDALGREGIRYESVDALLAEMTDMTPAQRETFLNDAMPFNRMFVLQAYSQLKMKTDASGMPLSFRALAAQEIPTFRTQDWLDLIRVDPDAIDEPSIWSTLQRTALGAMLQGRDGAGRREIAAELEATSEDAQSIALSPKTGETIDALAQAGILPSTHTVAAGRVMYFLCIGTLRLEQATTALEKIGLPLASAEQIASKLGALLPASSAPEAPAQQQPAQRNVPSYASRNIIDLRKKASSN